MGLRLMRTLEPDHHFADRVIARLDLFDRNVGRIRGARLILTSRRGCCSVIVNPGITVSIL